MYLRRPCWRDVAYGQGPDETADLFPVAGEPGAPLFVFIHGGYWRALHSQDSVFMAQQFTAHGVAVAAINYTLAPQAALAHIVGRCRRALAWSHGGASAYGIAPQRTVLAGSSAGAHLAAMLLGGADAGGQQPATASLARCGIAERPVRPGARAALPAQQLVAP